MNITATYSPEDNKLRLYASARLDAETYSRVKAAGYKWAPKQSLFVAPAWNPEREDLALALAGELGDEDTSLVERAESKAERLHDLSDKRPRQVEQLLPLVEQYGGSWDELPAGTFKDEGTMVNTALLSLTLPAAESEPADFGLVIDPAEVLADLGLASDGFQLQPTGPAEPLQLSLF